MKLIGLAGTNGSGKDTVGLFLAEQYNYLFISITEMLREECRARSLEPSRENLRFISAEWRRQRGLGVLVDKAVDTYQQATLPYEGLVVASLRNQGEAERVHALSGQVIWVDADPRIRYERIKYSHRGRDEEDNKSYEEFLAEETAEMHASGDSATLNMAGVRELADIRLRNETTLTDLQNATRKAFDL